jgi:hypothetical protein
MEGYGADCCEVSSSERGFEHGAGLSRWSGVCETGFGREVHD